jgi:hypothetical protein
MQTCNESPSPSPSIAIGKVINYWFVEKLYLSSQVVINTYKNELGQA